jgi:S-formylglutathione hydrolase FrmB
MEQSRSARRAQRRRQLLIRRLVALGCVLLVVVIGVGASYAHRHGGASGAIADATSRVRGQRVEHTTFHSRLLKRDLEQVVALPKGFSTSQHRPLLVFLHGRKSHPSSPGNRHVTEALAGLGDDPNAPVVLFANGGTHSYFHDRRDGKWGSYVTTELVPDVIHRYHLDASRVAYAGISMGGYGALELTRESRHRACAVVGIAPALWARGGDSAPGAYDDAADFAAHDVLGAVRADTDALHGTPVWLAGGDQDPFHAGTDAMAAALRGGSSSVVRRRGAGGHDGGYWNSQFAPMMRWVAARFATC